MQPKNSYPRIVTDDDMREAQSHGEEDFPFQYYLEDIWDFDFHTVDWHWHPEWEFVVVRQGSVHCSVGNEEFLLQKGHGLFVNSCVIHRMDADSHNLMPNIVFSPALLAHPQSRVYRTAIQPYLSQSLPFLVFSPDVPWQAEVLSLLETVFAQQEAKSDSPLRTLVLLLKIWDLISTHTAPLAAHEESSQRNSASARLQIMMAYIHQHYVDAITLDDIAATVFISKSSALQIFQNAIHLSPVAYLIQYRLQKAAELLLKTNRRVNYIAEETGFRSTGYFCRKFRERFGLSPLQYRQQKGANRNAENEVTTVS